jgi:membrane-associated phospholipid phosphatase
VGFIPNIFSINNGLPTCAPCDPATLPGIDRWAVSTERTEWDTVSDVMILVLAGASWYDLSNLSNRNGDVAASVEATAWTFGVNQLAKAIINRNRPILYSEDAIEARESVNNHRSMYSAHASTAFALGTSYFLSMDHKDGLGRTWPLISAAAIAGLRLAAAKHFPTDIVVGAILGTATAIAIHAIRF